MKPYIYKFIILISLFSANSYADLAGADKYARDFSSNILNIVSSEEDINKVRQNLVNFIKANVDVKWTAKFTMGKNWRRASKEQKEQFVKLFEDYLVLNYAPKFTGYNGENFEIIDTKEISKNKYINKLSLTLSNGQSVTIEIFIIEKRDGSYKAVDISGEGISFAATQRTEFSSLITMHGIDKFLTILEEKTANLKAK